MYLSRRDHRGAASTLNWKAEHFENIDPRALTWAEKIIDLFSRSDNTNVLGEVYRAYIFLYQNVRASDPEFPQIVRQFAKFLERSDAPDHNTLSLILEFDENLDVDNNNVAIEILQSFLYSRETALSQREILRIKSRLAANLLYVGRTEEAIILCNELIIRVDDDERIDYLLWCGEAFADLGINSVALMYFNEVARALQNSSDDNRLAQAKRFIEGLSS